MGWVEEGWHFLAGLRTASPALGRSDSADRQAPDAISGGAPLSAQCAVSVFSMDRRKQGRRRVCGGWGQVRTGWQKLMEGDGEHHLP